MNTKTIDSVYIIYKSQCKLIEELTPIIDQLHEDELKLYQQIVKATERLDRDAPHYRVRLLNDKT